MRCLWIMFVTAVCFLFLLKLKWPKNKKIRFPHISSGLRFHRRPKHWLHHTYTHHLYFTSDFNTRVAEKQISPRKKNNSINNKISVLGVWHLLAWVFMVKKNSINYQKHTRRTCQTRWQFSGVGGLIWELVCNKTWSIIFPFLKDI